MMTQYESSKLEKNALEKKKISRLERQIKDLEEQVARQDFERERADKRAKNSTNKVKNIKTKNIAEQTNILREIEDMTRLAELF